MARYINNLNELQRALEPVLTDMTNKLADQVYKTLNYFLYDYYHGWTPESYRRTEAFLRSAVKVDAKPYRNGVKASVYIDLDSMDSYVNATGFQVATWANSGLHGGLKVNHMPHVWDDTLNETINNGSLLQSAIHYLKDHGFDVRQ